MFSVRRFKIRAFLQYLLLVGAVSEDLGPGGHQESAGCADPPNETHHWIFGQPGCAVPGTEGVTNEHIKDEYSNAGWQHVRKYNPQLRDDDYISRTLFIRMFQIAMGLKNCGCADNLGPCEEPFLIRDYHMTLDFWTRYRWHKGEFAEYAQKYGKNYSEQEAMIRAVIFEKTLTYNASYNRPLCFKQLAPCDERCDWTIKEHMEGRQEPLDLSVIPNCGYCGTI